MGKIIRNKETEEMASKLSTGPKRVVKIREMEDQFKNSPLAVQIAESTIYYLNYYYQGGRQKFPLSEPMTRVSKYFPYSKFGPLYIDEADITPENASKYIEKQVAMKDLGLKYLVLTPKMSVTDALERLV